MQDVVEFVEQQCSSQDVMRLHLESREWECLRPSPDGVQFLPRLGQAGAFLSGPDDTQTLHVWGGKIQVGEDETTMGDQSGSQTWNEVDSVFRYALLSF